jgi:NDP-sugar pyrophosphorylase family protein
MPDLIARAVAEGLPVHVFPILERWFDIGSPEEFERVLLQFAVGEEGE